LEKLVTKDVAITWISGADFCALPEVQVYLNSLVSCGFQGDRVIFTHDMPAWFRTDVTARGFTVIDVAASRITRVSRDRHVFFANYLNSYQNAYRFVVVTDSRDVLFQSNPVEYLQGCCGPEFVVLAAEGMHHIDSPWNMEEQAAFQQGLGAHASEYKDWLVLNGGIQLGTVNRVRHLLFDIWLASLRITGGDQAALNYIGDHLELDYTVKVMHPASSPFCVTGEGINVGKYSPMPRFKDGLIVLGDLDTPYFIFHQWNRTEWRDAILKARVPSDWKPG
jgi:hypothetical protein